MDLNRGRLFRSAYRDLLDQKLERRDMMGNCLLHLMWLRLCLCHLTRRCDLMDGNPWHVLHVLSNHEKKVAQHLHVRDVEYYLPLYKEKVRWTDRTVMAERPLFSGYVFTRFDHTARIPVISAPGVLRLLGEQSWDLVKDEELEKSALVWPRIAAEAAS